MLRKIILIVLNIGFILILNSCCTKELCLGFDHLNEIQLSNFTADEIDSMAFEIFPGNSNFTNRIDSFFISAYTADSEKTNPVMFTPELLSATNDYKITILKSGLVYSLTGFETQKESCNNCVWGNDYYTVLKKYYVNGTEKHADYNTLIIDK